MAVEEIDIASVPPSALNVEMRIDALFNCVTLDDILPLFAKVGHLSTTMLVRYLGQKCYHHPLFFPSSLSVFYDWFWQAFFMIRGMQNCTSAKKSWVHPLNEPLNYETVRRSLLHYHYFSLSEKSEGSEKAIKKGYYFYLLLSSSAILSSSSKESALPLQRLYLLLCFLKKIGMKQW